MSNSARYTLIGALTGVFITIPAIIFAVASGGAGHGDYAIARVFFPLPMLITRLTSDTISVPSIILAFIQFPIYGGVLGSSAAVGNNTLTRAILVILLLHAIPAAICFAGVLPYFS